MKKLFSYSVTIILILAITLSGCGGGNGGGGNGGGGNGGGGSNDGSGLKTAEPYPNQIVSDVEFWSDQTFQPPNNSTEYDAFLYFLADITGVSDANKWPESAKNAAVYMFLAKDFGGHLLVSAVEYKRVSNALFFEYTNWYQPNSTLTVALSSINETSVTESITKSVGLSLGYDVVGGLSGSITRESSKTVTTAKGIEVATTYDLTQYDQSKLYKVILVGNYGYVRYHFRVQNANHYLPEFNTDGNGYIGYLDTIKVHQETMAVKLVHN